MWWCHSFLRRVVKSTGYWQPLIRKTVLWNPLQMKGRQETVLTIWKALIDTWCTGDRSFGWRDFFENIGATDEVYSCPLPPLFLPASSKFWLTWLKKGDNGLLLESPFYDPLLLTLESVAAPRSLTNFQSTPGCGSIDIDKVSKSPLILVKFPSLWYVVVLLLPWFSCSSSYSATTLTIVKTS